MRGSISCVILKFKPFDAVFFNTAFSNTLRPCGLTFPRTTRNRKSAVPQNRSRSLFAPRRPVLAGFYPRWGNDPPPPGQGPVWATQGPVWQKEKKTVQPGKQPPAQTANMPAFDFPPGARFPQKPAVERGVKKEQVKGPGSPEASRAGSLRPAEPSVTGFLPGVNFPVFRGRFGGLGVTIGVRNTKFPGDKPFLRVSPPGSTKG